MARQLSSHLISHLLAFLPRWPFLTQEGICRYRVVETVLAVFCLIKTAKSYEIERQRSSLRGHTGLLWWAGFVRIKKPRVQEHQWEKSQIHRALSKKKEMRNGMAGTEVPKCGEPCNLSSVHTQTWSVQFDAREMRRAQSGKVWCV